MTRTLTPVSLPDVNMEPNAVNVFFSRVSGEDLRPLRVTAHGDSLSVESDGKRRQWFAWRSDTAFYAGEETVHNIEGPRAPIAAFGFPLLHGDCRSNTFKIYGTENKVRNYMRKAVYASEVGGQGTLVLPEGDTLKAVVAVKDVLTTITDSVECRRETVRWFRAGEHLPVGIYIKEGEAEFCYAIDAYELRNRDSEKANEETLDKEYRMALQNLVVDQKAGYIELCADFPEVISAATLSIGITDVAGHLFALEERVAAGRVSVRISTIGLRTGEYIVVLSLSQPAIIEKRYISVRQ